MGPSWWRAVRVCYMDCEATSARWVAAVARCLCHLVVLPEDGVLVLDLINHNPR